MADAQRIVSADWDGGWRAVVTAGEFELRVDEPPTVDGGTGTGPQPTELLLGAGPSDLQGTSRIRRNGDVLWEKPFLTGEANMSHSLANLEAHHFKYSGFRRPGDVHVHFFGTATLSFSEGVRTQPGDVFEIEAAPFTLPLRNPLAVAAAEPVTVRAL